MDDAKGTGAKQAKSIGIDPEEHFREEVEQRVKQENDDDEDHGEPQAVAGRFGIQKNQHHPENDEIGDGVANEDGPEKVLRIFEVAVQDFGGAASGAHLLPHAHA